MSTQLNLPGPQVTDQHVVAHISDLHIGASATAESRLELTASYLRARLSGLSAVVVTGDIADHGRPAEYAVVRQLLDFDVPVVFVPGNHDDRSAMRSAFDGMAGTGDEPLDHVVDLGGLAIVACDVIAPGQPHGEVDDRLVGWIEEVLTELNGTPALICMHHNPVDSAVAWIDAIALRDSRRLEKLLLSQPDVVAVLAGHVHSAMSATFAGHPLVIAPGVSTTVTLPWEASDVSMHTSEPPGVAFHVVTGRRVVTHFRTANPRV
ncbi:MAG: metallophosphoesterase [Acidothermaceae bacterium]